ncbi:MAG: MFS transporter [Planctomycetia bacterium]|nr:MFS transporter [Planctomycetia bacterium]MDO5113236.1 MFS transporter [Planctomycetia bacterium]
MPLRWFICFLLFLATALCFLDRQVLSVLSPEICQEFGMSESDYAYVTNGFLISYAVMFLGGGLLIDFLGTRWGLGLSVAVWTFASGIHAVICTPFQMAAARFLLGAGEGGCFPGAAKAAAEWFPAKERALAIGIAIGGASLGGIVAPPLTLWLDGLFGWRGAFAVTGLLGAIWCVLWFIFFHTPRKSPWIAAKERELLLASEESATASTAETTEKRAFWRPVFGLSLARFLFDPVFYFYMFWIPKYLAQECGATAAVIAWTGVPFMAMGVTNIVGGFVSDFLVRRGMPVLAARRRVMLGAALVTLASSLVPLFHGNAPMAILLMSTLMLGHGFWITNYVALVSDTFARNRVATVMGITGLVGTLGGLCGNTAIGWVADHFSFTPIWVVSGLLYPAAFVAIFAMIRQNKTPKKEK